MAKGKSLVPFDNIATELSPGVWEFSVGDRGWRYRVGAGINVYMKVGGKWQPCVHVESIELAAVFAEGFGVGEKYGVEADRTERATAT